MSDFIAKYGSKFVYSSIEQYAYCVEMEEETEEKFFRDVAYEVHRILGLPEFYNFNAWCDVEKSSGLGSSSALVVSIIKFLLINSNRYLERKDLVDLAYRIEREILEMPGGIQDHIAAVYPGSAVCEINCNGERVLTSIDIHDTIPIHLTAFFKSREVSSDLCVRDTKESKDEYRRDILDLVNPVSCALERGEIENLGRLIHQSWCNKRSFGSSISTNEFDDLYDILLRNGDIYGGKLSGAGGGGAGFFLSPISKKHNVVRALSSREYTVMRFL